MTASRSNTDWTVFELRQYTLRPGQRDVLIELFDREFVETQEAVGMWVVGQFRDLDRADRFVWVRGFHDMTSRARALAHFYGGPVWKEHAALANATMIDTDDVLLLRPVSRMSTFPEPQHHRPPAADHPAPSASLITATVCRRVTPAGESDGAFTELFTRGVQPLLAGTGARLLACLQTEPAENNFPALPVRTEHVFVWFCAFAGPDQYRAHSEALNGLPAWRETVLPQLLAHLTGVPEQLRLAPTGRSLLR